MYRSIRILAGLTIGAVTAALAVASPASAKPVYTHGTDLRAESCTAHANYPKGGVPDRTWAIHRTHNPKRPPVGVRYTRGSYAMVLDHTNAGETHWVFVARSCLKDPYAYSGTTRLGNLRAVGGSGAVKAVPTSAAHQGKRRVKTIHLTSVGTLRSAPQSFAIGNLRGGDRFEITTATCGHHSAKAWILGYAPAAGRWGYVEALHLPACR
ncbi:hypothetical protein ACFFWC_02825 [Plantactinospora siamensis]|uniref:SH3 domain-containing protein n=1 Tax=Plantactinospora siamensis TaxID=555372 RepID=A0ABV6NQI5_9ACTN